jgi:hypothetical protein
LITSTLLFIDAGYTIRPASNHGGRHPTPEDVEDTEEDLEHGLTVAT